MKVFVQFSGNEMLEWGDSDLCDKTDITNEPKSRINMTTFTL